jgi:hypothetical protein
MKGFKSGYVMKIAGGGSREFLYQTLRLHENGAERKLTLVTSHLVVTN